MLVDLLYYLVLFVRFKIRIFFYIKFIIIYIIYKYYNYVLVCINFSSIFCIDIIMNIVVRKDFL